MKVIAILCLLFAVANAEPTVKCTGFPIISVDLDSTIPSAFLTTENYPTPIGLHPWWSDMNGYDCLYYVDSDAPGMKVDCKSTLDPSKSNCNYNVVYISSDADGQVEKCDAGCFTQEFPSSTSLQINYIAETSSDNAENYHMECTVSKMDQSGSGAGSGAQEGNVQPADCPLCGQISDAKIVGGDVATYGKHIHQVALTFPSGFQFCGGSIIAQNWVVTAAHCVNENSKDNYRVKVGAHDKFGDEGQIFGVINVFNHPGYGSSGMDNDISLLELDGLIDFNDDLVGPICLPYNGIEPQNGELVTVSGYGTLSSGGSSPALLHEVDVNIVAFDECSKVYSLTNNMICAAADGKDSCQGDSGGPLIYDSGQGFSVLTGVVSFGYGCAEPGYPGVYTRVTQYLQWIDDTVNGHCANPPSDPTL